MMHPIGRPTVHLATEPVDMRKSINGLSVLVADHLELSPLSGSLFVFYNKARDKIKILYWDRNGFCLWYKRLEKHRFIFRHRYQESTLNYHPSNYHGCSPAFISVRFKAIRRWLYGACPS